MKELRKRKRKTMVMGLLILLVPGVIWSAGQLIHALRASGLCISKASPGPEWVLLQPVVAGMKILAGSLAGEAHAAEPAPPSVVRKKLPAGSPAPAAQTAPAAPPAAAVPAPAEAAPPPKEPAPIPVATPSVQTPVPPSSVPAVPQRPMVASPKPEAPSAQAPAVSTSAEAAPKPETAAAPAASPPAPPIVKPFAVAAPKPVVAAPKPVVAAVPAQNQHQKSPYSILLSSCRERENALETLSQFRQKGFSPYIVQTEVGKKGVWWRTLMGSFNTLEEALAAINTLKLKDAVVVKTPYANLIGEFASGKDAVQAAERLAGKGLHPYTVNGSTNSVRLVVGGFATPQAAESYRLELEAKGISSRVVRR